MGRAVLSVRPLQQVLARRMRLSQLSRSSPKLGGSAAMSAAVYLDLESGAQRIALRHGEHSDAGISGHGQQRRSREPRAVPAVGVRYLSGPPLRPGDGRSGHHGQRFGGWTPAIRRRSPVRDLRRSGHQRRDRTARAQRDAESRVSCRRLAAPRDARVRHVRDAVHGGRLRASRASRSAGGHPAGRLRDRRSASPLAVRAPPAALAADRRHADRERHADMEVSSQSARD